MSDTEEGSFSYSLRCSSVCVYVSKRHGVKPLKEGYEEFKFSVKFVS